jgi:vacuolar-type H+-ATPase subunit H
MNDIFSQVRREFYTKTMVEWAFWILASVLAIVLIKWLMVQYNAPEYEFHVWVSVTLYLWYISTLSLIISSTYFIARYAQTYLERRQNHPQKPDVIDLENDLIRIKKIKKRAAGIAIVGNIVNAGVVYYVTQHIPGITHEFRLYAVVGVFAIAAIKPAFLAINTIKMEVFGMIQEADYPEKSVADLWRVIDTFKDYEQRLDKTFERIEEVEETTNETINETLERYVENIESCKQELTQLFNNKIKLLNSSDQIRETAYAELRDAQTPLTKEVTKILAEVQSLQAFVIDLRDKNIKGEQLMSALKEFGIDSLSDLGVTFEKKITQRNPLLVKDTYVREPLEDAKNSVSA